METAPVSWVLVKVYFLIILVTFHYKKNSFDCLIAPSAKVSRDMFFFS